MKKIFIILFLFFLGFWKIFALWAPDNPYLMSIPSLEESILDYNLEIKKMEENIKFEKYSSKKYLLEERKAEIKERLIEFLFL